MLKECLYAWYPRVGVSDYSAIKPDSYEIECLYRQANNYRTEQHRPVDIGVPTIGFRISRKTAQQKEQELSSLEFLRRCKSDPLLRQEQPRHTKGDNSSHQSTEINSIPKPPKKDDFAETSDDRLTTSKKPGKEQPSQIPQTPLQKAERKCSIKVRPFSASCVMEQKRVSQKTTQKPSSARAYSQSKSQLPADSLQIIVTPKSAPVLADQNSSIKKTNPKPLHSVSYSEDISNSNKDLREAGKINVRGFSACGPRSRVMSASAGNKGLNTESGYNKENIINPSGKILGFSTQGQGTERQPSRIAEPPISKVQHKISADIQRSEEHKILDEIDQNVANLGNKTGEDNLKEKTEVRTSGSPKNVRDLALKEIKSYNDENFERDVRQNGWKMEIQGNKFGLKTTPVRLPYWVPMVVPKVAEQPPVFYTKTSSTFFYNTIPKRPQRITISPNWHSEVGYEQRLANLCRRRKGYNYRNWSIIY